MQATEEKNWIIRLRSLAKDDRGALMTDWVLLTIATVFPGAYVSYLAQEMARAFFFRMTGIITLPFP